MFTDKSKIGKSLQGTRANTPKTGGGLISQTHTMGSSLIKPTGPSKTLTKASQQNMVTPEKNLSNILMMVADKWNGNEEKVNNLLSLTYKNGTKILDVNRKDVLMEIIGMLTNIGYENVMEFLVEAETPDYVVWEQPSMDESRDNLAKEIAIKLTEEKGIKGVGKCIYCNSNELIFALKQTSSGDEGSTTFIRCVECGRNWRMK
jgi:DNA-directed RNA polymerase subunit M/transcription elongation factor TFIIS